MSEQPQNPTSSVKKTPRIQPESLRPPEFSAGDSAEAAWKAGKFPNPPDPFNPDPVTLRDQWRFAIRQYSRWYSQAWGTAILAGISFFALGWIIKGSNPLPSLSRQPTHGENTPPTSTAEGTNVEN
ncbi:uncharacterized protein LOC110022605 [Phalaenopsis equestris]|uniref:uncharacterized protein LOC110022605 n=1 Tax=Phalaenopsis equestris TaxID=78828 RepID=UPI0009E39284|nr:uncharacterized protein LOC110022605 [Phalaenopsis equestris]XP_020577302.1 uncharacterized protein LOC110022605 [Phalaenopsis equestris]